MPPSREDIVVSRRCLVEMTRMTNDSRTRFTRDSARDWDDLVTEEQPNTGEMDLEERQALKRVAGLSTELQDVTEVEYRQLRLERVVLVGVWTTGPAVEADNSLLELRLLAETAGSEVLEGIIQRRQKPDTATYIGSGKVLDLRDLVA